MLRTKKRKRLKKAKDCNKVKSLYHDKVLIFSRTAGNVCSMEIINRNEFDFMEQFNPQFSSDNGNILAFWHSDEEYKYQICADYETDPIKIQMLKDNVPGFFFHTRFLKVWMEEVVDEDDDVQHYELYRIWCRNQGLPDPQGHDFFYIWGEKEGQPLPNMTTEQIQVKIRNEDDHTYPN